MNYAQEIKDRITMRDLLSFYGIYSGYGNRIPCPLHHGKNKNFAFKDGHYKCFKCGATGDVITFVQEYFGLSFQMTLKKINEDFSLNLPMGKKLSRRENLANAQKTFERKQEIKAEKKKRESYNEAYQKACDEWAKYDNNLRKYRPKSEEEELHPLFVEAAQNINIAAEKVEDAERRMYEYEHGNSSNS